MTDTERIQELERKLARTEGERDVYKELAKEKRLSFAGPWQICSNCGMGYFGSHVCYYFAPKPYYPYYPYYPNYPYYQWPITITSATTSATTSGNGGSTITSTWPITISDTSPGGSRQT